MKQFFWTCLMIFILIHTVQTSSKALDGLLLCFVSSSEIEILFESSDYTVNVDETQLKSISRTSNTSNACTIQILIQYNYQHDGINRLTINLHSISKVSQQSLITVSIFFFFIFKNFLLVWGIYGNFE